VNQPVVSIVIPAHNEEKWIAACLESVLRDSYPNKEVIVVDDASTDGTGDILKRFPITVIRNEKRVGPSSARNIGVREAKGEIIVFIDAHCIVDDVDWIEKFLGFFRDPYVGAAAGYLRREPSRGGASLRFRVGSERRLIKSANGAYRKALFEQVGGFDASIEWAGDAVLTYKVRRSGWKVVHSRDITVMHAEKLWPFKRAFLYGTCFFPLLKRYPREILNKSFALSSMGIGLLLTFGLVADLLFRFPIFTVSFMVFISLLNGAARNVPLSSILRDGFYTTVWSLAYYMGAIYGGIRKALPTKSTSNNKGSANPKQTK
jgi:glycosyltransferase involved in cell wall biosynthesis